MSNLSRPSGIFGVLFASLLVSVPLFAQDAENGDEAPAPRHVLVSKGEPAAAIDRILSVLAEDGFGGAIIASHAGEIILDAGYGYAVREGEIPFTTDTIAQIGSLTKQFTAMAVIDLALRGDIGFDAPVSAYLPGAAEPARNATIHQLLTHSSGMPEYCGRDFDTVTKVDLLQDCMGRPLRFEPGADTAYSNPGYSVLAAVVEAVSGETLEDYLRDTILVPNGLENTGYLYPAGVPVAHGYLNGRNMGAISGRIADMDGDFWALKGNGGMQATARDMYRWFRALSGDGVLSPRHIELATTPRGASGAGNYEAYGWIVGVDDAGNVARISHAGSDGVFFSYFWWRPQEDVFYYLVGNSGEAQVLEAVRAVRAELRKAYVSAD